MFKIKEYRIMFVCLSFIAASIFGWIENIIKLYHADIISGVNIVRLIGVFLAPLGVVMGYL